MGAMAHALIITARSGGGLCYTDDDVVQVLDGDLYPGGAVAPTESGFSFVYCSDKAHDDPEVLALMDPWEGSGDPPEQLGLRRYQVALADAAHDTWVAHDDAAAAAITKTWAEILSLRTDKAGA